MDDVVPRRTRLRQETEAQIKDLAWEAMAGSGPEALSLRDVARRMGMAPSALYRYFPSRDELLAALVVEAYDSLGAEVEQHHERARARGADPLEAFVDVAHGYRDWALAHRAPWRLIFSSALPDVKASPGTADAARRSFGVLQRITADASAAGLFDTARIRRHLAPDLVEHLAGWARRSDQDVPPEAVAGSMWAWVTMQGAISLDVNGLLPHPLLDDRRFFESAVRAVLAEIRTTAPR